MDVLDRSKTHVRPRNKIYYRFYFLILDRVPQHLQPSDTATFITYAVRADGENYELDHFVIVVGTYRREVTGHNAWNRKVKASRRGL